MTNVPHGPADTHSPSCPRAPAPPRTPSGQRPWCPQLRGTRGRPGARAPHRPRAGVGCAMTGSGLGSERVGARGRVGAAGSAWGPERGLLKRQRAPPRGPSARRRRARRGRGGGVGGGAPRPGQAGNSGRAWGAREGTPGPPARVPLSPRLRLCPRACSLPFCTKSREAGASSVGVLEGLISAAPHLGRVRNTPGVQDIEHELAGEQS